MWTGACSSVVVNPLSSWYIPPLTNELNAPLSPAKSSKSSIRCDFSWRGRIHPRPRPPRPAPQGRHSPNLIIDILPCTTSRSIESHPTRQKRAKTSTKGKVRFVLCVVTSVSPNLIIEFSQLETSPCSNPEQVAPHRI